jgi:hypothetical protein
MATYDTIDKMRRIANDPAASSAEREFAERKLREYSTALVVVDTKNLGWRDRAKARTATMIAEEQEKRDEIAHRAVKRASDAVEEQRLQGQRMEKARADHNEYMVNATNRLADAEHKLKMDNIRRERELAEAMARGK